MDIETLALRLEEIKLSRMEVLEEKKFLLFYFYYLFFLLKIFFLFFFIKLILFILNYLYLFNEN